jgi:lysophospholipase
MLAYMQAHLRADSDLDLGGPSVPWLYRALAECRSLAAAPLPAVPSLVAVPSDEAIVCVRAMQRMLDRWPAASRLDIPGGRHETIMETADRQRLFYDACAAHFDRHG